MFKKVLFTACFIASSLLAQNHTVSEPMGVQTLSSQLRVLLSQEMLGIEKGMKDIMSSIIAGDYENIEKTAKNIKNSFILEQKLTSAQKQELHTKLPQSFIKQDSAFHNDAKMLEHVANSKNPELTHFYFTKMVNACISCHQTFAQEKFPLFKTVVEENSHSH